MAEVIDAASEKIVERVRSLVRCLAEVLVDAGASVSVKAALHEGSTILMLTVAPNDLGCVIGEHGRTARSLRVVLAAASMKYQHRFLLDISQQHNPFRLQQRRTVYPASLKRSALSRSVKLESIEANSARDSASH